MDNKIQEFILISYQCLMFASIQKKLVIILLFVIKTVLRLLGADVFLQT